VDKFQGNQADYILLSLVRTKSVGHLRDVRRLVVALSRARLGLYIFGRWRLFKACPELAPAMEKLALRPTDKLNICTDETFTAPATKRKTLTIDGVKHMADYVHEMRRN
jgi:intron-binding protein aquarius